MNFWLLVFGGYLMGGRALADPSPVTIAIAVYCLAAFSLLLLMGIRRIIPMRTWNAAERKTRWRRLLIFFGVGFSLFGLALVLLSSEAVVLWVVASALLLASLLWTLFGSLLVLYGRILRFDDQQGSNA